jgi:hypothetical protein
MRPLRPWCFPMNIVQCSICRRAAAWMIDSEVFCEGHKEAIIENFGVDRFRHPAAYECRAGIPGRRPLLQNHTEEEG